MAGAAVGADAGAVEGDVQGSVQDAVGSLVRQAAILPTTDSIQLVAPPDVSLAIESRKTAARPQLVRRW